MSAHELRIERGRYEGLNVEDRICNLCNANIEDEFHFLMNCPSLLNCRTEYFNMIKKINTNSDKLSTEGKFIWLLSNENKKLISLTSKLLAELFKERKLLKSLPCIFKGFIICKRVVSPLSCRKKKQCVSKIQFMIICVVLTLML